MKYCEEILIKLNIPVSIDENNLFKYDPNSVYYTDSCYSYTTENGTDIILKDRQKEFSNNNLSLCENNCSFSEYDKSLISREFGYFLLLHETNFKSFNNSLTISPKNESDIYTTKFNVAKDLMNRILYIQK